MRNATQKTVQPQTPSVYIFHDSNKRIDRPCDNNKRANSERHVDGEGWRDRERGRTEYKLNHRKFLFAILNDANLIENMTTNVKSLRTVKF